MNGQLKLSCVKSYVMSLILSLSAICSERKRLLFHSAYYSCHYNSIWMCIQNPSYIHSSFPLYMQLTRAQLFLYIYASLIGMGNLFLKLETATLVVQYYIDCVCVCLLLEHMKNPCLSLVRLVIFGVAENSVVRQGNATWIFTYKTYINYNINNLKNW